MSFRYYVLTSGPLWTLERQFTFLKTNETVVVINSLNKEYVDKATDFCVSNDIEHYVTESDGTPSTGKNSVLRLFLESDNEYMVHVDGDDMITPYGRNLYRTVANQDSPPDIICLANELSVQTPREDFSNIFSNQVDSRSVKKKYLFVPRKHGSTWPHDMNARGPQKYESKVNYGEIDRLVEDGIDRQVATVWMQNRKVLEDYTLQYGDQMNTLNRLVFISRKSAELMNYDTDLVIGEDAYEYYKLKKLSYEGVIDMQVRNEKPRYSYLYMQDTGSTTRFGSVDLSWIQLVIDKLNKMDFYPVGYRLPEFEDPYYEVNKK